jgi:peptidoglycan/xylan/chitin deacetylase (PgdA/CDA1 family)
VNLLHHPRIQDYVAQHLVCSVPMEERCVAFTFDDGPNPAATPRLLQLLEDHGARATFFLLGRNVERFPDLAAEIAARGHEIGNHTHTHATLPLLPRRMMLGEMERATRAIERATGHRPSLFRPPLGWFNRSMLQALAAHGYRGVLGDVYPQDAHGPASDVIVERVLHRIRPGSIVILHDGIVFRRTSREPSLNAVETLLGMLRARDYVLCTVSELLARGAAAAATAEAIATHA